MITYLPLLTGDQQLPGRRAEPIQRGAQCQQARRGECMAAGIAKG